MAITKRGSFTYYGNESIYGIGSSGNDRQIAGRGNDSLYGNGGNDTVIGGAGNDYVNGYGFVATNEPQFDWISGGAGSDTFVLGEKDMCSTTKPVVAMP
jgi:Ca2+-binding RTX toxin-like protein